MEQANKTHSSPPKTEQAATKAFMRITFPRFALSSPAAASGPGVGGSSAWAAVRPAVSDRPVTMIVRLLLTASISVIGRSMI